MQRFFLVLCVASADQAQVSPIEKVLQLIGDLQAKVIKDGDAQQRIYENFTDFCNDDSKALQREIKEGNKKSDRLSATIDDSSASITDLTTKIESLTSSIASDEADLKEATELRAREHAEFLASDESMGGTISALGRAISIIEKEMNGGASLLQADTSRVSDALEALVGAYDAKSLDKQKLQALLQQTQQDSDEQPSGAPDAAAYENKSGGILSVLEDMLEKAQAQQSEGQKAEMEAAHNFAMLKQGLEDALAQQNKDLAEAKKAKASAEEAQAEAQGALERTKKELATDTKTLKDLQFECMTKAEEFEVEQKERAAELEALATAKKILEETTGGAAEKTYGLVQDGASFVQVSMRSGTTAGDRIVQLLQKVSTKSKAQELAQLAVRVRAAMVMTGGADPFKKVKGMINEMLEKLIKEAQEEAEKKAFCDKEMSETEAKKDDKSTELDDLQTKIDKFEAKIAKLTEQIAMSEKEIGEIAAATKEATTLRNQEKAVWQDAKADFEKGLGGVQLALQVLRDYYAQKDSLLQTAPPSDADMRTQMSSEVSLLATSAQAGTTGASGIIGMLEVAESDITKMLTEGQSAEDQAAKEYETFSEDNKVAVATKETEAKYAAKDKKETEALLADTKEDASVAHEELDAILQYWEKLQPQCVAKPEPYEERKQRREEEIAGLKEALEILEAESAPAFLQRRD